MQLPALGAAFLSESVTFSLVFPIEGRGGERVSYFNIFFPLTMLMPFCILLMR